MGGGFFMLELSAYLLTSPHGGVRRGDLMDWYSKLLWIGCGGGGLLMLALSASLLTSSLCSKR